MGTRDANQSVNSRVSAALDRIKQLVSEDAVTEDEAHPEPRNVEEAVGRLKRKVDDGGKD